MSSQIFNGRSAGTLLNPHFFYKQIVDGSKTNWLLCIMEGPRFEGLPGSKKGLAKSNSLKLGLENPGRPKNGFLPHPPQHDELHNFRNLTKWKVPVCFVKQKNPIPFILQDSWNLKLELHNIPSWEVHWSTQVNLSKSLYEHNWIAKWTYFLIS